MEVTNMGRAEREGWNTWERFIAAGAVENTLLWTDDPILVDNTIGRMKDKLRKCWPIDAAVAYTLANHGEDASLTWADLVNQNTRIASVMMTGRVGYGLLTNPASLSCGHDEVDCYEMSLGEPFVRDGMICFRGGSGLSDGITEWDKYPTMPDDLKNLCHFRYHNNNNQNQCVDTLSYLSRPECAPLLGWLAVVLGTDKIEVNTGDTSLSYISTKGNDKMTGSHTKGVCGFGSDHPEHGSCSHHDDTRKEDWYMVKENSGLSDASDNFLQIWARGKSSVVHNGWNYDQFSRKNLSFTTKERIVSFNRVKRSLAQSIPEEIVIKHIRESLQRMKNWDGRQLVLKTGIGRNSKHCWSDWSWLTEINTWVQDTRSKNRKENETQCGVCYSAGEVEAETGNSLCRCGDGWKYIKHSSSRSYGHEIAKFEWRPITEQKVFRLAGTRHSYAGDSLPWFFSTKEHAAQVRDFIPQIVGKMPTGGVCREGKRVWDLSLGSENLSVTGKKVGLTLESCTIVMTMKWDKNPENLPNAVQTKDMLMFSTPANQNQALDMCKKAVVNTRHDKHKIEKMVLINSAENVMENE